VAEKELKRRFPERLIRVFSGGVGAYQSTQEFLYFSQLAPATEADIVVFLSGWNDTYFGFQGHRQEEGNDRLKHRNAIEGCLEGKLVSLAHDSLAFKDEAEEPKWEDYPFIKLVWVGKLLKHRFQEKTGMTPTKTLAKVSPREVVSQQWRNLELSAFVAEREGVRMVFALQPDLYSTKKPLHAHEQKLRDNFDVRYPGLRGYFCEVYSEFRRRHAGAEVPWVFWDLDEPLSNSDSTNAFFVDHVHFGERGQRWAGNVLAERLTPLIQEMSAP
jgi:hypothetical protein